jgi:hypothetical protein
MVTTLQRRGDQEVDASGNSITIKYQIENNLYKYVDGSKCILSFTSINMWMAQNVFCHSPKVMS